MTATFRARIARSGVQFYETGPEQRDSSEVFAVASLRTLDGIKVQVSHDAGAPQVGYVRPGSAGRVQGPDGNEFLTAELVVTDSATIAAIRAGTLKHISCGYQCTHVVRDGITHQTRIIFDHVALLRAGRETPRCGTHCAVTQDGQNTMTQRYTDAIDGNCTCDGTEADRERIQGYLDHYADQHAVRTDAIVNEIIRVHGPKVQATKILIADAAARLNGPVNAPPARAVYHDGTRTARPAPANAGDAAFRQALAAKERADGFTGEQTPAQRAASLASVSGDDPAAQQKLIELGHTEARRLEREHARALAAAGKNADDQFRAELAKRAGGK